MSGCKKKASETHAFSAYPPKFCIFASEKKVGKEEDPFLLGFGQFSGASC